MIRVVLDTNIIVSALLQPLGPPAQVFVLAVGGSVQLCVSGSIYAEYEEVIGRPRFRRSEDVIGSALHHIREKGLWVKPTKAIRACSDPDDDVFLECAYAAHANYLVPGNLKHFPTSCLGTRIVTARRFLNIVSGGSEAGTQ
jgi:putative PIN family toxin of toxin-antitoxin system